MIAQAASSPWEQFGNFGLPGLLVLAFLLGGAWIGKRVLALASRFVDKQCELVDELRDVIKIIPRIAESQEQTNRAMQEQTKHLELILAYRSGQQETGRVRVRPDDIAHIKPRDAGG